MSGPVAPPLEVTEVDGSPDGRPITKIIVSNGDLSISGREATIDTSGSATVPGTPAAAIQFNSDPAGTFTGSDYLKFVPLTPILELNTSVAANPFDIRAVEGRGVVLAGSVSAAGSAILNQVFVAGESSSFNGIWLDPDSGDNVQISGTGGSSLTTASAVPLILSTNDNEGKATITLNDGSNGDIDIKTDGTGITEIQNATTDQSTTLSVRGNGTGDSILQFTNDSESVEVLCDANNKLKVKGGSNTFIIDVSGAATGITFPDGTTQTTAASGGGNNFNVELTPYGSYDGTTTYNVLDTPPYGNASYSAEAYGDTDVKFHAFIAPYSGDVATATVYINGTGDDVELAVYDDDGDGFPSTLLGTFDLDASSTGSSSTSSFSATITTVRGTQYWLGHTSATATSLRTSSATYAPAIGPVVSIDNTGINAWLWDGQTTHQTVVAGDKTDFVPKKIERIKLGFTWS